MARRCRSAALAMSKAPFFAVDPRWWPDIAAELPLPWTESAVLADLRWHEDQVWAGLMSMPGARKLSKRWGWTHWQARQVLKAEESWRDGHTPKRVPHTRRTPAAQEPHTDRTDSERKPAESQEDAAHPPHTGRTPAAQKPPHARSTQHTSHSTQHNNEDKRATEPTPGAPGERAGSNLSTDSDPLARFAATSWRTHFEAVMGYPYRPGRSAWTKLLPTFRALAAQAGCTPSSTLETKEGHRLDGAVKHYITVAKGRGWWTQEKGDVAPSPRTLLKCHWQDCLAAAPAWRCPPCDGSGLRHGAYLVSTGDRVETKNFACEECRPEALAKQRAILAEMGRVEGETFWVRDVYPHEPLYPGFYNLVQETKAKVEAAKRGSK